MAAFPQRCRRGTPPAASIAGRQAGISAPEFAIAVAVIGLLLTLLTGYARQLAIDYERASLSYSVNTLAAAVTMQFAKLAMGGELDRLPDLESANPQAWVRPALANYAGQYHEPDFASIKPGWWYFDRRQGVLVYRFRFADAVSTPLRDPARARFKVSPVTADSRADAGEPGVGLRLVALDSYHWRD